MSVYMFEDSNLKPSLMRLTYKGLTVYKDYKQFKKVMIKKAD